ncbi:MAG: hypothetical protein RMM08_08210, partial [Armatimonadota bacterium]|nr:hypothetical protein [Armatimonadota bacterium]
TDEVEGEAPAEPSGFAWSRRSATLQPCHAEPKAKHLHVPIRPSPRPLRKTEARNRFFGH